MEQLKFPGKRGRNFTSLRGSRCPSFLGEVQSRRSQSICGNTLLFSGKKSVSVWLQSLKRFQKKLSKFLGRIFPRFVDSSPSLWENLFKDSGTSPSFCREKVSGENLSKILEKKFSTLSFGENLSNPSG